MKINKHIEIVRSAKPWLSSLSQESCDAIFAVLSQHYVKVGVTTVNERSDLEHLVLKQPDLVFLGMKFIFDGPERVWLGTFMDEHDIAYTGSAQVAHSLEYDKALAKQCIIDAGLATAPFCVIKRSDHPSAIDSINLNFPLFVKPLNGGGGLGIDSTSVVRDPKELHKKIQTIADELQADSLVEEYLPGREFSVAILKNEAGTDFRVMPLQLIAPQTNGVRLLSEEVKSSNAEQVVPVTDLVIKRQVEELAVNVFHALGARDYGRIDIRLSKDSKPHFLEANLIPSLIDGYGSFPKACVMNIGLGYESMILRIVNLALKRNPDSEEAIAPAVAIPVLGSLEPAPSII